MGEPERRDDVLHQRRLPGLAAQHLDQSSEHAEGGVVVGEQLTGREHLRKLGDVLEVLLDGIVAAAGVGEDVALEPAHVAEEMARGDRRGGCLVGDAEDRKVVAERRVEIEQAVVDELHDERRGPHLRDRADLEDRVRRRLDTGRRAEHAGRGVR